MLCPIQPALSAYQRKLYHNIHGPDEPLPTRRPFSNGQEPKLDSLPPIPATVLRKQDPLPELSQVLKAKSSSTFSQASSTSKKIPAPSQAARLKLKELPSSGGVVRETSRELFRSSDPNVVMTRYQPPLETLRDPLDVVERLWREPELGFLYLTPIENKHSVYYNPYNVKYVFAAFHKPHCTFCVHGIELQMTVQILL